MVNASDLVGRLKKTIASLKGGDESTFLWMGGSVLDLTAEVHKNRDDELATLMVFDGEKMVAMLKVERSIPDFSKQNGPLMASLPDAKWTKLAEELGKMYVGVEFFTPSTVTFKLIDEEPLFTAEEKQYHKDQTAAWLQVSPDGQWTSEVRRKNGEHILLVFRNERLYEKRILGQTMTEPSDWQKEAQEYIDKVNAILNRRGPETQAQQ